MSSPERIEGLNTTHHDESEKEEQLFKEERSFVFKLRFHESFC